jgi:hypothetical protein
MSSPLLARGLELKLIAELQIPKTYEGARLGGFSGIDYDSAEGEFVVVSDDRSTPGFAPVARLKLVIDDRAGMRVDCVGVGKLPLPGRTDVRPDCESIRLDPKDHGVWCASEGDSERGGAPLIWRATSVASEVSALRLPDELKFAPDGRRGPRQNLTIEGMAFSSDGKSLWFSLEAPLREDGEPASADSGCWVRFYEVDRAGAVQQICLYPVDRIPQRPQPGKLADNGVAEILFLDHATLLVLERSGVQNDAGEFEFVARIFAVEISERVAGGDEPQLRKTLVLDSRDLKLSRVDNLEGMSLGPRLADGTRTLVLVADDNFSPRHVNQLLVFKIP